MPCIRLILSRLRHKQTLRRSFQVRHRCATGVKKDEKSEDWGALSLGPKHPVKDSWLYQSELGQSSKRTRPRSVSRQQLTNYILNHIVYEDDHILAFNKPNGLALFASKNATHGPSQIHLDTDYSEEKFTVNITKPEEEKLDDNDGGNLKKQHHFSRSVESTLSLHDVIPDLQQHVNSSQLEIGMPLSRLYSGIVVMTKTPEARKQLMKFLNKTRSQKIFFQKFSVLTVGIPTCTTDLEEDVLCKQAEIDQQILTIPSDKFSKNLSKKGEIMRCCIQSQIISTNKEDGCSFWEINSTKDKWDLVEWYCTQRLCSALGDHIYSPRVGSVLGIPTHVEPHIAIPRPQVLPSKLLRRLCLKEDQVSSIPLHIHRGRVTLTGFPSKNSPPIILSADLPEFFNHSLNSLHLSHKDS